MAISEAGNGFDQSVIPDETWSRGIQLSSDGRPEAKPGGVTFDWSSVTALAKDTYLAESLDDNGDPLPDAVAIPAGEKVLRYGTPIQRRTSDGAFVLALTGGAVGRGDVYLVNQTVLKSDRYSAHPNAIQGGGVFKARILRSGTDVIGKDVDGGSVASGTTITMTQIETALPRITYAQD